MITKYPLALVIALFVYIGMGSAAVAETKDIEIFFTVKDEANDKPIDEPRQDFECSERIYAVANIKKMATGAYTLVAHWHDPGEKKREQTENHFFIQGKAVRLWSWLKLSRPTGGEMISFFSPSYGMDEFIGEWSVDFYINETLIAKKTFNVIC